MNDSCRLALIALNETCRNDYNVVVNSYEYDEVQGVFKIDLSELKGTPYEISQVYLDGKNRTFGIVGGKEQILRSIQTAQSSFIPESRSATSPSTPSPSWFSAQNSRLRLQAGIDPECIFL